jgi:ketosteroid isomerase-like protein
MSGAEQSSAGSPPPSTSTGCAVARDFFDPEAEYHDDPAWPGGGAHKGRDAVVARSEEVVEVSGITHLAVERVVDNGDAIAWVTARAGRRRAGRCQRPRVGLRGRLAGGRLIHLRAYYDAAEALQELGAQR